MSKLAAGILALCIIGLLLCFYRIGAYVKKNTKNKEK